jgi:hypothetical protein
VSGSIPPPSNDGLSGSMRVVFGGTLSVPQTVSRSLKELHQWFLEQGIGSRCSDKFSFMVWENAYDLNKF